MLVVEINTDKEITKEVYTDIRDLDMGRLDLEGEGDTEELIY